MFAKVKKKIFRKNNNIFFILLFCLLILHVSVSNFSVMSGRVFLGQTSTKQRLMCLA